MKVFRYILFILLGALFVLIWKSLPILSGYGAKVLCSGVFVAGREPEEVERDDLGDFPFNLVSFTVDRKDQSVTGSVLGLARKKAVFRQGLGGVLLNGVSEEAFKNRRVALAVPPSLDPDTVNWPQGDRIADTLQDGVDRAGIERAIDGAFREGKSHKRRTRAVIVLYKGQLVGERYAPGFSRNTMQLGWSMTKSITNALLGILVKQGKLDIRSAAPVEAWRNDERRTITLTNLMNMRSGLRWWEFYAGPSACTDMLFKEKDMGAFATGSPLKDTPGIRFTYSSGTANILSAIIRQTIGDNGYYRFPYEQLFFRIGMYHTLLEPDAGGTFVGSSYCYATPRDWARFGLLYLNDGVWGGERILPEGWVDFTRSGTGYGALWWLKKYPHVPADCYSCEGYEGQHVWVIPSRKLVVVRLALEHGDKLDTDHFLGQILASTR
ncbi:MAG: serine hydrolase [Puia sp.]|nr:serine hydrolase [Puia sp.]